MVEIVDVNRYMGLWYEITAYPEWFEKRMTDISAHYTLKDGYVEVLNSGYRNGVRKEAKGRAVVVKNSGNKLLKVSFFRPFYGKYLIVNLADDYSWVVVSNPKHKTLWILSRTKTMDIDLYNNILVWLKENHFDVSKLKTPQVTYSNAASISTS